MFDFIPIATETPLLAMYPKQADYDIGLFIRPYTRER